MRVAVFSTKPYDEQVLQSANREAGHDLHFFEAKLTTETASLARGAEATCAFVNDELDAEVIGKLSEAGVRLIVCALQGSTMWIWTPSRELA